MSRQGRNTPHLPKPARLGRLASIVLGAAFTTLPIGCGLTTSSTPALTADQCGERGCPVEIRTRSAPRGPDDGCLLTSITGVLTVGPNGLGIRYGSGQLGEVIWPFGYVAFKDELGVALYDRDGRLSARERDRIRMTGWIDSSNLVAHPCDPPDVEILVSGTSRASKLT